MSQAVYQVVTKTIIEALEKGVVPWKKPWHATASIPVNTVTRRPYRGVNLFLLSLYPFEDNRWLTYRQAIELGGRVRAGERGSTIVFWKCWKPGVPESEQEPGVTKEIPLLRYYTVFNAEQCESLRIPGLPKPPLLSQHQRIERAELILGSMPNPPKIVEGGCSAWYRPSEDKVQIPKLETFRTADSYYATLFHELGHASGHPIRLNRKGVTGQIQFGSGEYSKEELVAELTSAFCCATASLDNTLIDDAASYIAGWIRVLRNDMKAIVIAAAQAQRAADYILNIPH